MSIVRENITADGSTDWATWPFGSREVLLAVTGDFGGGTVTMEIRTVDSQGDPVDSASEVTDASFAANGQVLVRLGEFVQYRFTTSGSTTPDVWAMVGD